MKNNTQKVLMKLFVNFLLSFILIFVIIAAVNIILPIMIEGFESLDVEEIKIQLVMTLTVMVYTVIVIFALKSTSIYFDMLSIFSVPRNEMIKSINVTNIILTITGSAFLNLIFLMVNIPERLLILALSTLSIYLILNFLNFIAFLGKIFGWYYVVGSFVLLASFIIAVSHYIGAFILAQLYIPQILLFFVGSSVVLIFVNRFLSTKYEYKQ